MMSAQKSAVIAIVACILAHGTFASRELTQVPTFQSSGLDIVNSADPAARQSTPATIPSPPPPGPVPTLPSAVPSPSAGAGSSAQTPSQQTLPTIQVPAPATGAAQPPAGVTPQAPAPSQAQPLPVVNTPAPAPAKPVVLPVVNTPVPAPSVATPPAPLAPAPAPAVITPVLTVPTPAPAPAPQVVVLPSLVPTPAPVPAPGPQPIPQCGVRPTCRLFVEDMLCCNNSGTLTSKQHATMRLQCTHPVNYTPQCFNVTGPRNLTAFSQFDTSMWSQTHLAQVNFLEEYMGNVTIDIEGPRTNGTTAASCGLFVTPCMFEGEMITTVAPVQGLSFTTITTEDFMEISESVNGDINNLDSLVMPNLYYPSACQQQNVGDLDAAFFSEEWVSYTGGFQNQCNYTAFTEIMAPLSAPAGTVQTASLG